MGISHVTRPLGVEGCILSDDEDYGLLSDYKSDDNYYDACSNKETDEVLQ